MKSFIIVLITAGMVIELTGCGAAQNQTQPSTSSALSSSTPKLPESSTAQESPSNSTASPKISIKTADQTRMQAVDFLNSHKGFLAGNGGVWETNDGGHRWISVYHHSANFHSIQFTNGQTGWIWSYRTLLSTTNGGKTWHRCYHTSSSLVSVSFTGPENGYAVMGTSSAPAGEGGPGNGLYETRDGGRQWHPLATPFHPLAVAFRGQQQGWAVGLSQVWHTTDKGKEWTPVYRYGNTVPTAAQITVAAPGSIWVTLDGGSGMSQTSYTVLHEGVSGWQVVAAKSTAGAGPAPDAIISAPSAPELAPGPFAAVNNTQAFLGGVSAARNFGTTAIWATLNGGQSWTQYPPIYGANGVPGSSAVSFATPQKGWLIDGLNNTQVLATNNRGQSWHQVFPSSPNPVRAMTFVTNNLGYGLGAPGHPNQILVTHNGGKSWSVLGRLPVSAAWEFDSSGHAMDFANSEIGWAVRQNHLFRTSNGAKTWTRVLLPEKRPSERLTRIMFVGQDGVVGSPYSKTCWWTVNGGRSWNYDQHETFSQALTDSNRIITQEVQRVGQPLSMAGAHGSVLWIMFQNQSWALSSNNGTSWTMHTLPRSLSYSASDLSFTNAEDGWLQIASGSLYHTVNGGTTWHKVG